MFAFIVSILEVLGLASIIPVLENIFNDSNDLSPISAFIANIFNLVGLEYEICYLFILIFILFLLKSVMLYATTYYQGKIEILTKIDLQKNIFNNILSVSWPLYNQNPAFVGITLHQIDSKVDNGPIYHQQKTIFSHKDSIHEIFCKTILQAAEPATKIIDLLMNGNEIEPIYPNNEGRLFFGKEFNPNHLRIIYQLIEEGMLKNYLDNESLFIQPKLKSVL